MTAASMSAPPEIESALPPGVLRVIVTYLQMPACPIPLTSAAPPEPGLGVVPQRAISVPFYRMLYRKVGEPWLWLERLRFTDVELARVLRDPLVEVLVLEQDGRAVGYAELDRRRHGVVDLAYFGLFPEMIGRKIGPWFLDRVIERAWAYRPQRMTVNTCTFDHPRALAMYRSRGFEPVQCVARTIGDPRLSGVMPRTSSPHVPLARDE